nr:HAD family hydrolase [Phaeobacter sp.]
MERAAEIYRTGSGDKSLVRVVAEAAGPNTMSTLQISACLARAWDTQSAERLLPGVAGALGALSSAGFRLVLASNTRRSAEARGEALERLGIAPLFSDIVVSSAVGSAKPELAFFDAVQQAALAAPTVFVGDSFRRDVLGALRAGMAAIWVAPTSKPQLRRCIGISDGVARLPEMLGVAT